jgi:TP901 family phage tail tape measure protein
MDNINALGNNMALSNQDIVEGMERSAAALAAVGSSYEDAFAMFSGIQEVLQNAEKSGTALRSVALRIRSFDESTEEYSDDLKNITGELADLTKTAEHSQGISIFKDGSTTEFKSLVDYFGEISSIWSEMSQKQQNDYLIKAFGRTQAQAGSALIQNYSAITKSLEVMDNAAGSSDKEMETVRSKQNCSYVQKCA